MTTIVTIAAGDLITNSRVDLNTNFTNLNSDKIETSYIDTDTALAANSDTKVPSQKAVKTYIDTSGGANASTTVRGIVEEATQAEVDAGTAAGSTGARLFVNPSTVASASTIVKGLVLKKKIEVDATEITHANSLTETTLFDVSIPGGTLSTNNAIHFKIAISDFDVEVGEEANFLLKYGTTTIGTANLPNSSAGNLTNRGGFIEGYIVADGATNAQKGFMQVLFGPSNFSADVGMSSASGTSAEDSTAAKTLTVSLDWGTTGAGNSCTAEFWIVELIA